MKLTHKTRFALLLTMSACAVLRPVHKLIDQKEEFIWTGSNGTNNYLLTVDDADGIWFTGKIIIDSSDTLYLKGFEKGSNHPTTVKQSADNSISNTSLGRIFIWTKGFTADTVRIDNMNDSIPQLPIQIILIKTKKQKHK